MELLTKSKIKTYTYMVNGVDDFYILIVDSGKELSSYLVNSVIKHLMLLDAYEKEDESGEHSIEELLNIATRRILIGGCISNYLKKAFELYEVDYSDDDDYDC